MNVFALAMAVLLSSNAWAQSVCVKTWPEVLTKIKDLRKLNDCAPEYTLKECQSNLGLVGAAGVAGAAMKAKQRKPTSCGLVGFHSVDGRERSSFASLLLQSQLPLSNAGSCMLKNYDAEKKEAQAVIHERKEAILKEIEAEEKAGGSSFEKVISKHMRLRTLHAMRADAIRGYMDHVGGPLRPEDLSQAVAKIDEQINDYVKTAFVKSEDAREELRAASRALERSSMTGNTQDGAIEFAAERAASGGSNAGKITDLKAALEKINVAEQALAGPGSVLPETFAKGLEAAAQDLPPADLGRIANIRMKFAEKFPNITMSRTSKLAINGFRAEFDKQKKRLIAKPKMPGKIPFKVKMAGGVVGAAISGITLAAQTTNEGRTDSAAEIVNAKSLGCAGIYSEWAAIDEECRLSKEWNPSLAGFVALDPASIEAELKNESNGDICQQILDMHKKYFSPTLKASCSGNSVILKDNSARQNYVASWDQGGALTSFKFNGEYKNNRGYTMKFNDGKIASIEHKGPIFSGSIEGDQLQDNHHAADFATHFSMTSPRVLELQACCMGSISTSDARCSAIESSSSGSGSGNGGNKGDPSSNRGTF